MLNRESYIKKIDFKLGILLTTIKFRGYQRLFDVHTISEDFFAGLLNIIYGYTLQNLNHLHPNNPGIDLGDSTNHVAYSITAEKTKTKIQDVIDKFIAGHMYDSYHELYVLILDEGYDSRSTFKTEGRFSFDPQKHIINFKRLLTKIRSLDTEKLEEIIRFLEIELKNDRVTREDEVAKLRDLAAELLGHLEPFRTSDPKGVAIAAGVPYREAITRLRKSYDHWEVAIRTCASLNRDELRTIGEIGQKRLGMKNLAKGDEVMYIRETVIKYTDVVTEHIRSTIQSDSQG